MTFPFLKKMIHFLLHIFKSNKTKEHLVKFIFTRPSYFRPSKNSIIHHQSLKVSEGQEKNFALRSRPKRPRKLQSYNCFILYETSTRNATNCQTTRIFIHSNIQRKNPEEFSKTVYKIANVIYVERILYYTVITCG